MSAQATAAEIEVTYVKKKFSTAHCDYHRDPSAEGLCVRRVNADHREILPLLYPSIVFKPKGVKEDVPKVYQMLLADVMDKLVSCGKSLERDDIDCYELKVLTYCGRLADHGDLRRKYKNPWKGYFAQSKQWTDFKETEICLDLSPTMYDAVKASGYRIGYQRPAPLVKRTQTTLLMTAQPTASVLSTTTNLDDIPHDATSSEGFPTSDDAFPPPWVTWYMNAASTSEVDPDPVAAQWNAILQACVEPCFRMDDISTQQSGNAESLECSENAPVKNTVEASGSGTHDIPFPIASASPAPDFTHQRSAERATGSGHASSANSAHSTPGGSGHKRSWSLHEWEDDSDEDIDDIVARMEGIWLGTDEDAIVSNVLEEVSSRLQAMVTQLNSTLSETSLRGFLDDTLLSLRTFLDEANEWRSHPSEFGASLMFPLEDPQGTQRETWDNLMSAFSPAGVDENIDIAESSRIRFAEAMSTFAAQTFRPQTLADCQQQVLDDEWLQKAMLPPDQRDRLNQDQALFDSRLIGRDLDDHVFWRNKPTMRSVPSHRAAIIHASLMPRSTRRCWTKCFERLYEYGEEMDRSQVAAINEDLQRLRELVEFYVVIAHTYLAEIAKRVDILKKCSDRLATAPPPGNLAITLTTLIASVLHEIRGFAESLATLCREDKYDKIHDSFKTENERNFAPATTLLACCDDMRRGLADQVQVYPDVGNWLERRDDIPTYAHWKGMRLPWYLSEEEGFVESIMEAIRKPESGLPKARRRRPSDRSSTRSRHRSESSK